MKAIKLIFPLLFLAAVYTGCMSDNKATIGNAEVKKPKIVTGDFNGDGKPETVTLIAPKLTADGTACVDSSCTAYIKFSDTTITPIKVKGCIGGKPDNLGDLNGDGKDDIGLLPEWFTSCWRDYKVYTYKNDRWVYAVPPFPTHCNQWDAKVKPIEKDSLNKGYVVIRYSELADSGIVTKSKIIPVK